MTVKGGTSQACAACKYQRRRCTQDCALAPYFPADKPKMFQNAHRLFGVCNIMKILKMLDDEQQKEEAMKSIIYEADVRARFPVYGCTWVIHQLNQQLMQCQNELFYVNSMLDGYRNSREHEDDPNSQFQQFGTLHETVDNDGYYGAASSEHLHHLQQYPHSYNNVLEGFVSNDQRLVESSDVKSLLVQQNNIMNDFTNNSYYDKIASSHNINGSFGMMQLQQLQQFHVPQSMPTSVDQHEIEVESHDYDDMPFVTHADDRQSYIESKDACESRVHHEGPVGAVGLRFLQIQAPCCISFLSQIQFVCSKILHLLEVHFDYARSFQTPSKGYHVPLVPVPFWPPVTVSQAC